MIDVLILRLDAPLLSFGGPVIDNRGVTRRFPARSTLTGLLANALGYSHGEAARLESLQRRIRYAVRCDRAGTPLRDYQTVDLSQEFMKIGWSTRGAPQGREGGSAREGTHIRFRDYIADAVYTVAFALEPPEARPMLDEVETALRSPARPLFIGRKCCLPAAPILFARVSVPTVLDALKDASLSPRADQLASFPAWWPAEDADGGMAQGVCEDRDWTNQIHVGQRWLREGSIHVRT